MHFYNIKDEDFIKINNKLSQMTFDGCEFSKLYLKAWDYYNYSSMEIAEEDEIIYLRFVPIQKYFEEKIGVKHIYLPPICELKKVPVAINKIAEQTLADKDGLWISELPQEYVDQLKECDYKCDYSDVNDEYLYNPSDLIELKGKKYHSKRNHVTNFNKSYNWEFRDYKDSDFNDVIKLCFDWEDGKKYDGGVLIDEKDEEKAIKRELSMVNSEENCMASVLLIDNVIVGFTLGEITPSNIGIVHLEKCNVIYDGIYTKILNEFAKKYFSQVRFINRQEDLGIEGLRKSKQSYHPIAFCKKYDLKKF